MNKKHNTHYTVLPIEPWEIMQKDFTEEEFRGFLKGNILKYLLRDKEGLKDYEKLVVYANKLVSVVKDTVLNSSNHTNRGNKTAKKEVLQTLHDRNISYVSIERGSGGINDIEMLDGEGCLSPEEVCEILCDIFINIIGAHKEIDVEHERMQENFEIEN